MSPHPNREANREGTGSEQGSEQETLVTIMGQGIRRSPRPLTRLRAHDGLDQRPAATCPYRSRVGSPLPLSASHSAVVSNASRGRSSTCAVASTM